MLFMYNKFKNYEITEFGDFLFPNFSEYYFRLCLSNMRK